MKKIFTVLLLLVITKPLFAGWPINTGHYVISPSLTYYTSMDYWDKDGTFQKAMDGSRFQSETFNAYFGYGINSKLDIIGNLPISVQTSTYNHVSNTSTGFNDFQAGVSYNIINFGYKSFLSVQGTAIVPLYKNSPVNFRGYQSVGAEAKIAYTGGFTHFIVPEGYFNVETGFRDYFASAGPFQINYSASVGLGFDHHNQLILETGGVYSTSTDKNPLTTVNEQNIIRDFRYTKASATYLHGFTRHMNLGFGGFYTYTGRNTGKGYGGNIQMLLRY